MYSSTGGSTWGREPIRFGIYNIHNGRNGGLELDLQGMSQANLDLGIFQETKLTDGVYTHGLAKYSVVTTDTPSGHRGGVAVFYWPSPRYAVEAIQQFGPNVVRLQLAKGYWKCSIIRCYLSPNKTSMIKNVVTALKERPRESGMLTTGDFSANLDHPEGERR